MTNDRWQIGRKRGARKVIADRSTGLIYRPDALNTQFVICHLLIVISFEP